MIRIADLSWTYPHAEAACLRGIDLHIAAGEFVVLCGASGSGKSTILRAMNGLIPHFHPDGVLRGSVTTAGVSVAEAEPDEVGRRTGTVLQHPRRQFFTESVAEEVAFAMENFGLPVEVMRTQLAAALNGLAPNISTDDRLCRLSGGQQQQVAIAAASAHRPPVLLLDEPSANLGADAVLRLTDVLADHKAAGRSVVIAEHRLRYLRDLADRVVVLRDGVVHIEWTGDEFRRISDDVLAAEGLRGEAPPVSLPVHTGAGPSVAAPGTGGPRAGVGLELEGVQCELGGHRVIDIDYVNFPTGGVTALTGENGAGKSTLARIVTGLQRCSGQIHLQGRRLSRRARQQASAVVMQDVQRQLFADSVRGTVDHLAAGQSAVEVLNDLGLGSFAERHPLSLSGGQQQRLVIAETRLSGRRIVVFDEPSSGVDRRHQQSIAAQIRAVAQGGAVVILISHDYDLLSLAADSELRLAALTRSLAVAG